MMMQHCGSTQNHLRHSRRPYSWGTKQIFEMLTDFKKAYEARQEYFLGAIVSAHSALHA